MYSQDSRRYHRDRRPTFERANVGLNYQQSQPKVVSPYGTIPYKAAGEYQGGFAGPLARGILGGPNWQGANAFGQQIGGVLRSLIPQASALGPYMTGQAQNAYSGYQASLDSFLSQLPGYTAAYSGPGGAAQTDQQAVSGARTLMNQAFSPVTTSSLFNNSVQQALGTARLTEASRGMLDTGASGAYETQNIVNPMASNYAQLQQQNEAGALQAATGASAGAVQNAATAAGTAAMGPGATGNWLSSIIPALGSALTGAMNIPASAANSVLSTLLQGTSPLTNVLQLMAPQVAQKSGGGGLSVGTGGA